jgi:tight adherence protein D
VLFFKKSIIIVSFCTILSGCNLLEGKTARDDKVKETVLLQTKDYDGLINLYRGSLKERNNPQDRFKLAFYYHEAGDYKSSLYYLEPLAGENSETDILLTKDLIYLGQYNKALAVTQNMIKRNPNNAEAWNLQGVASALNGDSVAARRFLLSARDHFLADEKSINNLAMLSIMDGDYSDAVAMLLPQYFRGKKSRVMMHNLVFALVKTSDLQSAYNIIERENLSEHPYDLIESLSQVLLTDKMKI